MYHYGMEHGSVHYEDQKREHPQFFAQKPEGHGNFQPGFAVPAVILLYIIIYIYIIYIYMLYTNFGIYIDILFVLWGIMMLRRSFNRSATRLKASL